MGRFRHPESAPPEPDGSTGPDPGSRRPAPSGTVTSVEEDQPETEDLTPESTFRRSVEEGRRRLRRGPVVLVATGLVGGVDIGMGVLALLLTEAATHSALLGGLAFGSGFIALALAGSELFTEGFLLPVGAVVARKGKLYSLLRLWIVTFLANLASGWVITYLIVVGLPNLRSTAVAAGRYYAVSIGLGGRAFALAVLGGVVITLMTWMQYSSGSVLAPVVAAEITGFLLGGAKLNHSVVASLVMFAALHTGHAGFGYGRWAMAAGWAALGNLVGGIGLVTCLRLLQVPHRLRLEREHPET